MKTLVRKATNKDLPNLMVFMEGLVNAERPMDSTINEGRVVYYDLSEIIKNKNSILFVVKLNNELVASGYAKIKKNKHYIKYAKQGYLGFMYVPENHRGNGYNKLIMDALLKWCKTKGVFEIRLDVYDQNTSAIRAYEKAGMLKHLINMRMNIKDLNI